MRRFVCALLMLAFTSIGVGAVGWYASADGVHVTVINNGPGVLSEVVVHVTGNEHKLGNLVAGEARTVRVSPSSESHVELTFEDESGRPHQLNVGGYFEPGYQGTIEVEIADGVIKRTGSDVKVSRY